MDFAPLKTKRLYALVVEQILESIRDGTLKPGDRLPSEHELAQKWQVSRPSVREALTALELMDVVESSAGRGTYVKATADLANTMFPQVLKLARSQDSPLDILEARLAVERHTAYLAAKRADDSALDKMESAISQMASELKSERTFDMESDRQFHLLIADAAGNPVLTRLAHIVLALTKQQLWLRIRNKSHEDPALPRKYHAQHEAILQALRERDGDRAAELMSQHLVDVRQDIFGAEETNND